ncbi:FAD-dependent oxidoreductase [Micromonospora sp. RHAY321]|uniref:FAD-binding oxidoreductase n=1 Tax=Micromonospora sp. RHAY321 TaxID=2944807 RepID=UPI00207CBD24|nr:FAD-binding protein [Micromonospora sp. RHAY321]MCO1597541.1 FAD-dependent oxidoreductase [Micromonospora sp. RHAY321]
MTAVGAPGAVARPGDPAYAAATGVFNLHAPVRPAAATTAHTVDEVRAAIRHARTEGLEVRVHATGHASTTAAPMDHALLIRTRLAGGVEIDTARRVARVPAGTQWGDVVTAAAGSGLAAAHGSSPLVGVVGYLLRGGLSFYGRYTGLAVNSLRAVELVTADGELRRVDAATDPELFWALRGGGGGFGVVTAVEFALFPAATVVTGASFWPVTHAARLLDHWLAWTRQAPWTATTSLRVLNMPAVPGVPPELTGGPVLTLDGAVLAEPGADPATAQQQADDLLGPLRAVAEPVLDNWQVATPATVLEVHLEPSDPVPVVGDHLLLGELDADAAATFLEATVDPDSPLVAAGLRQLGGRLAVPDPAGGALSHLTAAYAYTAAGVPVDQDSTAAITARCAQIRAALTPWDTGRTAPTFVENREHPQGHLDPVQADRVDRTRIRVDPTGLFRGDVLDPAYR